MVFFIYSKNALKDLKWCLIIKHYDFLKSVPFIVVSFSFVENPLIVLFSPFFVAHWKKTKMFFFINYIKKKHYLNEFLGGSEVDLDF